MLGGGRLRIIIGRSCSEVVVDITWFEFPVVPPRGFENSLFGVVACLFSDGTETLRVAKDGAMLFDGEFGVSGEFRDEPFSWVDGSAGEALVGFELEGFPEARARSLSSLSCNEGVVDVELEPGRLLFILVRPGAMTVGGAFLVLVAVGSGRLCSSISDRGACLT